MEEEGAPSRKRARVGLAAFDIISAIEVDTQCSSRQKALRNALVHLGEYRTQHGAFSAVFKRQSLSIAEMLAAEHDSGVRIVLEWYVP
jgi:hypothetical protein